MFTAANLALYEGDDYDATVTVFNSDGSPADLTGYTAQSQIRLGPADTNPLVVEIGVLVVLPNTITIVIPHAVTSQLSGHYQWDLQLTSAGGYITTILAGAVIVTPEITREGAARAARSPVAALPQVLPPLTPVYALAPATRRDRLVMRTPIPGRRAVLIG